MPLLTRPAVAADAPAIVALVNRAFAVEKAFVDGERTALDDVLEMLQKGTLLVAESAPGDLYACVYIEQRGYRAYLGMLAIDPGRQGQGVGPQLMTAAEEYCRSRRVRAIDIAILSLRPELPPFYRKLGYVDDGIAPCDNPQITQPVHFIRMAKNL